MGTDNLALFKFAVAVFTRICCSFVQFVPTSHWESSEERQQFQLNPKAVQSEMNEAVHDTVW